MLNTFLKLFQTDAAMVPFLFDVLERLLRRFLKLFVLKAVADAAVTPYQLIKTSESSFLSMIKRFKFITFFYFLIASIGF